MREDMAAQLRHWAGILRGAVREYLEKGGELSLSPPTQQMAAAAEVMAEAAVEIDRLKKGRPHRVPAGPDEGH
jgi:hypothetical protein